MFKNSYTLGFVNPGVLTLRGYDIQGFLHSWILRPGVFVKEVLHPGVLQPGYYIQGAYDQGSYNQGS